MLEASKDLAAVGTVNFHIHKSLDPTESVQVEKNTKGYNYTVKASSLERTLELLDKLEADLKNRTPAA
jgi:hypothetical protein